MDDNVVGANLERLRVRAGLTQEEVAQQAGLSRLAYRKIEKGLTQPREGSLAALAGALEVSVRDLVTPVPRMDGVRFRSRKRMRMRDNIVAEVALHLDDYAELEDLLQDRKRSDMSKLAMGLKGKGLDRAVTAAGRVRIEFLGKERSREPIFNICGLLEKHGIKVLTVRIASDKFFGLSVNNERCGPAVVVNEWERISVERRIFTAAHELGHLVLHHGDWHVDVTEEPEQEEKEADAFAAEFLMPQDQFEREWANLNGQDFFDAVLKLKQVFRVSYKSVLYRLSAFYPARSGNIWARFYALHEARYGRKLSGKEEPHGLTAEAFRTGRPESSRAAEPDTLSEANFKEDRLSSLVRRAMDGGLITMSRGAEILRIPMMEMRARAASWVA